MHALTNPSHIKSRFRTAESQPVVAEGPKYSWEREQMQHTTSLTATQTTPTALGLPLQSEQVDSDGGSVAVNAAESVESSVRVAKVPTITVLLMTAGLVLRAFYFNF
jgi:hypothetical protein